VKESSQKPRDCICGFPVLRRKTSHSEWCPAHNRISKKREEKEKEREYWAHIAAKDYYGRTGEILDE
jgi:protein involved in sex pheromone biosynthesis